jgi:glycogen operon protein
MSWEHADWQSDLFAHVSRLLQLRRDNPALRPVRFAHDLDTVPGASVIDWYDEHGETMSIQRWTDPAHRTLQYDARSTPESEEPNRVLLIVHGNETPVEVTLPRIDGVQRYVSLWSSLDERPSQQETPFAPGDVVSLPDTAMHLFRIE